jgi:hypothetical protein
MHTPRRQRKRDPTIAPKDPKRQRSNRNSFLKKQACPYPQYFLLVLHTNSSHRCFRQYTRITRYISIQLLFHSLNFVAENIIDGQRAREGLCVVGWCERVRSEVYVVDCVCEPLVLEVGSYAWEVDEGGYGEVA